jgi:hypothetical protein
LCNVFEQLINIEFVLRVLSYINLLWPSWSDWVFAGEAELTAVPNYNFFAFNAKKAKYLFLFLIILFLKFKIFSYQLLFFFFTHLFDFWKFLALFLHVADTIMYVFLLSRELQLARTLAHFNLSTILVVVSYWEALRVLLGTICAFLQCSDPDFSGAIILLFWVDLELFISEYLFAESADFLRLWTSHWVFEVVLK